MGAVSAKLTDSPYGPNISFNGRLLYSETSTPIKRVEGLPHASEAVYLIISPLLFHGLEELRDYIPADSSIVAVETDSELYRISLDVYRERGYDFDFHLLPAGSSDFIPNLVKRYRCRRIIPAKLNRGYMLNRKFYDRLTAEAENYLANYWKNRMTTIHMGRLWCRNILLNIPSTAGTLPFTALRTGKPVICAAAGESLENSIGFIKDNRSSYYLVAVDTAVTTLLLNDIKPDLVIALEAQHANLYDFYEDSAFDLPVAADLTSSPELVRKLRGPLYFFISRFEHSSIFNSLAAAGILPPVIPPLGSVGISALHLSMMLTDGDVLCTGLDFSFLPDKYHASGSPSHVINQMNENRLRKTGFFGPAWSSGRFAATDRSGRRVYTDPVMKSYSDTLRVFAAGNRRLADIAATGLDSGLRRPGTDELKEHCAEAPAKPPEAAHTAAAPDPVVLKGFLTTELEKLNNSIDKVVKYRNSCSGGETLPPDLFRLLNEIDYTWLFFPDRSPLPSAGGSYLKRLLYSASWFKTQTERALTMF